MRLVVIWLLFAAAAAELADEPQVEEEDVEEPYNEEQYEPHTRKVRDVYAEEPYGAEEPEVHNRARREAYVEGPYEEHVRVKRCCDEFEPRSRRSADYVRKPRQVQQYEVHEFTDESEPSSAPYEEMLAASADHYHRVYAAPGAQKTARYLNPEASSAPISVNGASQPNAQFVNSVQFVPAKLGQPVVHRPVEFAPSPLVSLSHAVDGPAPVDSVPLSQPLKQLSDGDQFGAAAGHHQHHHGRGHGHSQGGGHGHHGQHYGEHGGKTSKGFNQGHHVDKGAKGFKIDELHKKEYEEAGGKKNKHHDRAGHKGGHEEEAHGQKGSHFDEKKGHKKGHKTKGYHNKYHKDEFHKEHKFYDDYHKSGDHHRYGKFNAKHSSNESGKKKAHHVNAGHDFVERGKKGYSNKGHMDSDHKGHNAKHGHEEHHGHHSQHGKKGGKEGGSHWGYAKKN